MIFSEKLRFTFFKKMTGFVHSNDIFDYFVNVVCSVRANNLHTYSIGVALIAVFNEHQQNFISYCFKCCIYRLLVQTLFLRGYRNIGYISNSNVNLVILA